MGTASPKGHTGACTGMGSSKVAMERFETECAVVVKVVVVLVLLVVVESELEGRGMKYQHWRGVCKTITEGSGRKEK